MLKLFDIRYWDFDVKHLHDDRWLPRMATGAVTTDCRITSQAHGRVRPAPRRGAHRRKRPRRPMIGMKLQGWLAHEWVAGEMWELIVTMEDATMEICLAFFVARRGRCRRSLGLRR